MSTSRRKSKTKPFVTSESVIIEVGSEFHEKRGNYYIRGTPDQLVYNFLNDIYFILEPEIGPFTFGLDWALENCPTGERLHMLETDWSRGQSSTEDDRSLEEVNIQPGMILRPIRL